MPVFGVGAPSAEGAAVAEAATTAPGVGGLLSSRRTASMRRNASVAS